LALGRQPLNVQALEQTHATFSPGGHLQTSFARHQPDGLPGDAEEPRSLRHAEKRFHDSFTPFPRRF
jgi:hypothetical protein